MVKPLDSFNIAVIGFFSNFYKHFEEWLSIAKIALVIAILHWNKEWFYGTLILFGIILAVNIVLYLGIMIYLSIIEIIANNRFDLAEYEDGRPWFSLTGRFILLILTTSTTYFLYRYSIDMLVKYKNFGIPSIQNLPLYCAILVVIASIMFLLDGVIYFFRGREPEIPEFVLKKGLENGNK